MTKAKIDLTEPIRTYKVMVSEVRGFLINVAASSEAEALTYARLNKTYEQYNSQIVDTHYQLYTDEKGDDDETDT